MTRRQTRGTALLLVAATWVMAGSASGHDARGGANTPDDRAAPSPIRITMDELHAHGGVPRGWTFAIPRGMAAEGRKVFHTMECFACHAVKGEDFPRPARTRSSAGPNLTGMGAHHPPEYFAESILNPNRVIVQGSGYTGPDGLSTMPSYADAMTLQQLIDVVAYLRSLTAPTSHTPGASGSGHGH